VMGDAVRLGALGGTGCGAAPFKDH
jgi:hypothetical protein